MVATGNEIRLDSYPGSNPRDMFYAVKTTDGKTYRMRVKPKTGINAAKQIALSLLESDIVSVEPIDSIDFMRE